MREIEIKATSVEQAIAEGLIELGASRDQVDIDIITEPKLFKKACVKISLKPEINLVSSDVDKTVDSPITEDKTEPLAKSETTEIVTESTISDSVILSSSEQIIGEYDKDDAHIIDFVSTLFKNMNLNCTLKVSSTRDTLSILIGGEDSNLTIGYRGETLDAIQYITLLVANKPVRFAKRLVIDAEGYREKRAATLTALSKKLASQAIKSGKAIELEPMNPFERRVIHTALQENPAVTTLSEGDEPNRFVVICPVKAEPSYDSENKSNFKKQGFGKTRSFGQKKRRF